MVTYTFKGAVYCHTNVGMPINALSDAHEHLNEILVAIKTNIVWNDYT